MTDHGVDKFVAQTEQTKEVTRSFFEACNSHDLDKIMSYFHPDIVHHSRLSDYPKVGIAFAYQVTLNAFPDLKWNVQEIIAEGNRVASLVLFEGTHQGEYLGKSATGRSCRFFAVDFGVIEDGQFIEHRGVLDELHLISQIGVVPETFLAQMS
jgi:predicted ester cyclase